ncbi:MAG: hypothetical protein IT305_09150 [Chloroflexi bacterium]|nr:hypothetical protein [Chloroflexota bacterium]
MSERVDVAAFPDVCELCESRAHPLYVVPDHRRVGPGQHGAAVRFDVVCRFCYLRVVGIKPTASRTVARLASNGHAGAGT